MCFRSCCGCGMCLESCCSNDGCIGVAVVSSYMMSIFFFILSIGVAFACAFINVTHHLEPKFSGWTWIPQICVFFVGLLAILMSPSRFTQNPMNPKIARRAKLACVTLSLVIFLIIVLLIGYTFSAYNTEISGSGETTNPWTRFRNWMRTPRGSGSAQFDYFSPAGTVISTLSLALAFFFIWIGRLGNVYKESVNGFSYLPQN